MRQLLERLENLNESTKTAEEFSDAIKKAYYKEFPKGWIQGGLKSMLGNHIAMSFGVQPKKELPNGILMNDRGFHGIIIHDVNEDGTLRPKHSVDVTTGGNLNIKPEEGSHLAFGRAKIGWRKKTGTPEQLLKHMTNYFAKMNKVNKANKDNWRKG